MPGEGREMVALLAQIRDAVSRQNASQRQLRETAPARSTGGFGSGVGSVARARGVPGGTGGVGGLGKLAGPIGAALNVAGAAGRAIQPFAEAGLNQAVQGGEFTGGVLSRGLQALDESAVGQVIGLATGKGRDIRVGRRASQAAAGRLSNITGTIAALGGSVSNEERRSIANVFLEQEKRRANEQIEVQNLFGSREYLEKATNSKGALTTGTVGGILDDIEGFFDGLTGAVSKGVRDGLGSGGR